MAVQKSRVSRSKRDMRRGHDKIQMPEMSIDQETGEVHRRHHITKDGFYRGKRVIAPKLVKTEE
ncbi:MAG TPA: 50S ribosomal protein L32 [Gammaproteobacteria bacterium]|nr:50S ribosomal protein L32 [Gammaproteobacteria bacterium]